MRRFDRFIDALSRTAVSERAVNQYARGDRANAIRRGNLRRYLEQTGEPRMLLVGEAPSYRGGRLTGIPFTSESIMIGHLGPGYRLAPRPSAAAAEGGGPTKLSTEASATMVWATIRCIGPLPLLWNAFPFHPFVSGNPFSNRMPTSEELHIGAPFLEALMRLFAFDRVVAIGNLAERSLTRLGIAHEKVRHPSQGGKQKFVEGVARLASSLRPA